MDETENIENRLESVETVEEYQDQALEEADDFDKDEFKHAQQFADEQIQNLSKKYPNAPKSIDELLSDKNCQKAVELWSKGVPLQEAYAICNMDSIIESAKQQAFNNVMSKAHLTPVGGVSANDIAVPQDIMDVYHKMLPDLTDTEIRAEYKKFANANK